jgi:uracil-DNA glycosylase
MRAVSDHDRPFDHLRSRAKLMLRAERAFGANGVARANSQVDSAQVVVEEIVEESVSQADPAMNRGALPADPTPPQQPLLPTGLEFGPNRPEFASPALPRPQKIALLQKLDADEVKGCPKCDLCKTRTNTVFGEGDPDAKLMFIGEAPGENEDLQGRPFIGRAGELLTKMINGMGLAREQVYIANIVKCRPPNNRVPSSDEVATCTPYLERQIELIRPHAIVTLGLPSSQYMLQLKTPMGKMRGRWHAWRGISLMPTYHPAYLLRNYTQQTREAVWSDLQQVMKKLGLVAPSKARAGN